MNEEQQQEKEVTNAISDIKVALALFREELLFCIPCMHLDMSISKINEFMEQHVVLFSFITKNVS